MLTCEKCGQQSEPESRFCSRCGSALGDVTIPITSRLFAMAAASADTGESSPVRADLPITELGTEVLPSAETDAADVQRPDSVSTSPRSSRSKHARRLQLGSRRTHALLAIPAVMLAALAVWGIVFVTSGKPSDHPAIAGGGLGPPPTSTPTHAKSAAAPSTKPRAKPSAHAPTRPAVRTVPITPQPAGPGASPLRLITQVQAINGVLQQSAQARDGVQTAVSDIQSCRSINAGIAVLDRAAELRKGLSAQTQGLAADAVPQGATLTGQLNVAMLTSAQADRDYGAWARQVKHGCRRAAVQTSSYRAAQANAARASNAKAAVAGAWNPLAQRFKLALVDPNLI
jgi:hypothetical protein